MTTFADDLAVLDQALAWRDAGRGVALATVVATWGSSPRPLGSQLAVAEDGAFLGSVSGGCIEGAVVLEAITAIKDAKPRILDFGVSDEQAWEVGLACGGSIRIFVEPLDLPALADARRANVPVAVVTDLATGAHALLDEDDIVAGDLVLAPDQLERARTMLHEGASGPLDEFFVRVYAAAWRMVICGAVHIAQHLAPMAAACGYGVTVVDPRTAFATADRFPDVRLVHQWADEFVAAEAIDRRTAVVALTHDPKLDDPAIEAALRAQGFYVGALGSRRTHAKRVERLLEKGFSETEIARIRAPIGLDLGGRTPAEIAVAVLAQVIQSRYRRT